VVAKVEFHFGELFPRVGFIVTNLETDSRAVVRFYNKRGTAEQWIKEGKQAVKMTRLSCHRFRSNEVRLWLSLIAYNLGNLLRRLVLPKKIENWSLTSLQQRLVKTGGRLVKHARYSLWPAAQIWERGEALASRLPSFETNLLTQEENLAGLATINRELIGKAEAAMRNCLK
jgi:hypothetical protein